MKKMNNKGFSLVELIVVIAIMAVLVGVLAPQFIKYVESSRISTDMQNIQQMKTACEALAADAGTGNAITITGSTISCTNDPLTCKQSIATKSDAWVDHTWTMDTTDGSWSLTSGTNTTNGGKDTADIFE